MSVLCARKEGDTPVLPTRSTIPRNSVYKYANCRQLSANKTTKEMALCLFRFGYILWLVLMNVLSLFCFNCSKKRGAREVSIWLHITYFMEVLCYCLHKLYLLCVWECVTFKFKAMLSFVSRRRYAYAYHTRFITA